MAQIFTVSGTVRDENDEPLPGVAVSLPDSGSGTITDQKGCYSIQVPGKESLLQFYLVTYSVQTIAVQGRKTIDVKLLPDPDNQLNEAVVIGYGVSKKSDLTGSVATVKMQEIENQSFSSVDQALQGRMAGVDIMSTSGEPGAASSIRIRGTRSINASNEPLIVVDGVLDAVRDISEINPEDIESLSVMKDASSTAIYGSRGANGVILVSTKKGKSSRPVVAVKAEYGLSQLARTLDLMNRDEFIRYRNDIQYFRGASAPSFDVADYANDTDWVKEITRIAPYQNYNASVRGKVGDKLSYFGSLGYNDNRGIIRGSGFERYTARFNLSYDFNKWLNVALKLSYTARNEELNKANIGGTAFWDGAIYLSPIIGPYDTVNPLYENGSPINTPRANIDLIEKNRLRRTSSNVLEFTIKPLPGLVFKSQNSFMAYQRHDYSFWPSTLPKKVEGEGADAYRYEGDSETFSTENTLTWNAKFAAAHNLEVLAGFSASKDNRNYLSIKAEGLVDDSLKWNNLASVGSKENLTPYSYNEGQVKESFFARLNYNYKSKYYLTATGRYDASSNFAANNKWGFFPSAAFKWAVKKEKFLRYVRWVDDLSLRASVGSTGNDAIAFYQSLQAYKTITSSYPFGGSQGVSVQPLRLANPDLSWEKTTLYNIALDASFFKGKLSFTLEAYRSYTTDLLLQVQTIQSTGYNSSLSNLGLTSNTGVELSLDWKIFSGRDFGWELNFTASHNNQMVEDIGQEDFVSVLNSPGNTPFMMYGYKKGFPLNSLWGFEYCGVWHNEQEFEANRESREYVSTTTFTSASAVLGYPKYRDVDNDGILSEKDLLYLGNSDPLLYGGIQNTFHWGKFRLGFYFTYSIGGQIYNYSELSMAGSYASNQYRYMLGAWHPLRNPDSDLPRAGTDDRLVPSTLQVHDATYLRLKTASLGYTFDLSKKSKVFRNLGLTLSGNNLFLLSRYNGFDPDVSTNSEESTLRRVDMGAYPQARTVVLSAQLKF
ncbi:MAG: SusC/RagA family TonB-linked outer membrane protein [Candidatus Cryptobacteroides sp.]